VPGDGNVSPTPGKTKTRKYKITFNPNRGRFGKSKRGKSIRVTQGKRIRFTKKPKRKGYKFLGWYTKKRGKLRANQRFRSGRVKATRRRIFYARWKKRR
jgi:uncharacterized repeat protein (TIGR02543 family)